MRSLFALISGLIVVLSILISVPASGMEDQFIEDDQGDVMMSETIETIIDGFGEIDILSLKAEEDLTTVYITLTTKDDISSESGYSYDINAGGLYVSYSEGDLEINSYSDSTSAFGEVVDNTITVTVPKSELEAAWFYLSASTMYYDWEEFLDEGISTYSDEVSEDMFDDDTDDITRIGPIDLFAREIEDLEGDVVESTNVETPVSNHPELDIISISVTDNGDGSIIVEMELYGAVSTDDNVSYSIYMTDASIDYSGGNGQIFYYDGGRMTTAVTHSENTIRAVLVGSRISVISYINADASFTDMTEGTWISDQAGTESWWDDGWEGMFNMEISIKVIFKDIDEIEIRFQTTHGAGNYTKMIRSGMDTDGDGTITQDEIDESFEEDDVEEVFDPGTFTMDGKDPHVETETDYNGLLGPADSNASIEMVQVMTLKFDLDDLDSHTFRIDPISEETDPDPEEDGYDDGEEVVEDLFPVTLEIILPDGWIADPETLSPVDLKDHIDEDGNILIDGEDLGILENDDSILSITFIKDDGSSGNDSGLVPVILMVMIMLSLIILAGRRKRD